MLFKDEAKFLQTMELKCVLFCFAVLYCINDIACNVCSNITYTTLDDIRRSTAYDSTSELCDRGFIKDGSWYRFESVAGDKMPEFNPGINHCGTYIPIWMNGNHPAKLGEAVDRIACAAIPFRRPAGCGRKFDIKVINCGSFFLYQLKDPQGCLYAYCTVLTGPVVLQNEPETSSTTIKLSWKPVSKKFWNGKELTFQVNVFSANYTLIKSYTTTKNSAIISGLLPATTYIVNITGSTVFGRIENRKVTVRTKERCQGNAYRDDVENGKCIPCPRNSKTSMGKKKCLCKNGFRRFPGENHTKPCYEFPSSVEDVIFLDKTENSVTLLWKPPQQQSNHSVLYDITCNKCLSRNDSEPCIEPCGAFVAFKPSQNNLVHHLVTVKGLDKDTEYQFVIYSKNQNSLRISRTNWERKAIRIKTEGVTKSSTLHNRNNAGDIIPISVTVAAVVAVLLFVILVYFLWKRKRGVADYARPEEPNFESGHEEQAHNRQHNSNTLANRELPAVPDVEDTGGYEEPARYAQLDSSRRIPIDANYQGLMHIT